MRKQDETIRCSFCGRLRKEVERLVAGMDSSFICSDCVEICQDMLYAEGGVGLSDWKNRITPKRIKDFLTQYIVGQDLAKKIVSVAVYNHYKRMKMIELGEKLDGEIAKSNILFIGPTGTGKTLMAKTIAKILDVPFVIVDATSYTEAGYVGEDVENMLYNLYAVAGYDIKSAESGIIYIDEIDKIARKSGEFSSHTKDVSGEGVQYALLKMLGGASINVPRKRGAHHGDYFQINTSGILFIGGGAFEGLHRIIEKRLYSSNIGFIRKDSVKQKSKDEIISEVRPDDLIKFGLIPEIVGRFSTIATFSSLTESELYDILTKPRDSILKQYQRLLDMDGVKLTLTAQGGKLLAKESMARGVGARGLKTVMDEIMLDVMYEVPERRDIYEVIIDEDVALKKKPPIYIYGDSETKEERI